MPLLLGEVTPESPPFMEQRSEELSAVKHLSAPPFSLPREASRDKAFIGPPAFPLEKRRTAGRLAYSLYQVSARHQGRPPSSENVPQCLWYQQDMSTRMQEAFSSGPLNRVKLWGT